jgi:hypothetical protein
MTEADNQTGAASERMRRPLVFISHDSRDAAIAQAFDHLLLDASGGMLRTFRSSDRTGTSGIPFGVEWYRAIMDRLDAATDVVALLTPQSLNRPWILYEAGVAKGKLDTVVFGLTLGMPLDKASAGPFAQFQNSAADQDSMTVLVLELLRRNLPEAAPRREAVAREVAVFLKSIELLLPSDEPDASPGSQDANTVAKLFEELKLQLHDLADTMTRASRMPVRTRLLDMRTVKRLLTTAATAPTVEIQAAAWLTLLARLREDAPWLYEPGIDLYRAMMRADESALATAATEVLRIADGVQNSELYDSEFDPRKRYTMGRELPGLLAELIPTIEHLATGHASWPGTIADESPNDA